MENMKKKKAEEGSTLAYIHNQAGPSFGPVIAFDYILKIETFAFTYPSHSTKETSLAIRVVLKKLEYGVGNIEGCAKRAVVWFCTLRVLFHCLGKFGC